MRWSWQCWQLWWAVYTHHDLMQHCACVWGGGCGHLIDKWHCCWYCDTMVVPYLLVVLTSGVVVFWVKIKLGLCMVSWIESTTYLLNQKMFIPLANAMGWIVVKWQLGLMYGLSASLNCVQMWFCISIIPRTANWTTGLVPAIGLGLLWFQTRLQQH